MEKSWLYCSTKCHRLKPIAIVEAEIVFSGRAEYRPDIRYLLAETAKLYTRMEDWASALNISVPYLYTSLRRYFRIREPHPVTGEVSERSMRPDEFRSRMVPANLVAMRRTPPPSSLAVASA